MDPSRFYGSRLRTKYNVRAIPEDCDDSELSSESDEECNLPGTHTSDSETDGSADEVDPDQPSTSKGKTEKRPTWRQRQPGDVHPPQLDFTGSSGTAPTEAREPISYFREFISNDVLDTVVEQSNLFSVQKNVNKPLNVTKLELEIFIGILFHMGMVKMPNARMYWSKHSRFPPVADMMTVNRFEEIKSSLHINDNELRPALCEDKLYKVRPLIDALTSKFKETVVEEMLAADEQVIPFKGKSSLKTYNPKKPKKWGYKVYVLCGTRGLIYNMEFYTGRIAPVEGQPDLKASGNIVLRLLEPVPRGLWHKVFTDNWFTSPDLFVTLYQQQIACVGTVRANRLLGCTFPTDKVLKAQLRGASALMAAAYKGVNLNAVKWNDNKCVSLLSTFCAVEPIDTAKRWDKKEKATMDVPRPHIITTYNMFMGGVDLLDMLLALYRIPVRSKKWYHRIIWHLLDTALVQAWLLYKRNAEALGTAKKQLLSLLEFKGSVARCLTKEGKVVAGAKRGRPSCTVDALLAAKARRGPMAPIPDRAIRTDSVGHWPVFVPAKGRCKHPGCKGTPKVKCEKCNTYLCFTPSSNCFRDFHTN